MKLSIKWMFKLSRVGERNRELEDKIIEIFNIKYKIRKVWKIYKIFKFIDLNIYLMVRKCMISKLKKI